MTAMLEVTGLGHGYGDDTRGLRDVTVRVDERELVCVVGPSGCGKSTLLRSVAGLQQVERGVIRLRGEPVTGVPADLAVVFQDYTRSLFPWMSVQANVEFPLRGVLRNRSARRARAREALAAVGLLDIARNRPDHLSGGMQQRVCIARALAYRPSLMLMDEPFASVDAQTRADLEDLLLRVRDEFGVTVLLVTHDVDESVYLGDRVVVLSRAPSVVVADIPIDLPRPRDRIVTRGSARFAVLRTEVACLLSGT